MVLQSDFPSMLSIRFHLDLSAIPGEIRSAIRFLRLVVCLPAGIAMLFQPVQGNLSSNSNPAAFPLPNSSHNPGELKKKIDFAGGFQLPDCNRG